MDDDDLEEVTSGIVSLGEPLPVRLGRYLLTERIGAGGMAEVFRATMDGPGGFQKEVVVKRILPQLSEDQQFVQMFLREANVVAALNHAHVVQILELGIVDGTYFLAMEYVDGLTLLRLARRAWGAGRSLPTELVVGAGADAALGLHHAHCAKDAAGRPLGLVHRDVSPENLMISQDGITKVLDFGIARGVGTTQLTTTNQVRGKIPFLAPERIMQRPLDGRTDLYALGVTLYWLLAGKRPYRDAFDISLFKTKLVEDAEPPSTHNAAIPPVLDEIVLRLLQRDPDRRYANGAELFEALAPLAALRTQTSGPFVREMCGLPDRPMPQHGPFAREPDFFPSQPFTTTFAGMKTPATGIADGHATIGPRPAGPGVAAPAVVVAVAPGPTPDHVDGRGAAPVRAPRRAALVAAAVVAVVALVAVVAVRRGDDARDHGADLAMRAAEPAGTPPAADIPAPGTGASAPSTSPPAASAPASSAASPAPPLDGAGAPPAAVAPSALPAPPQETGPVAPPTLRRKVELRGPSTVAWTTERGAPLGVGAIAVPLPAAVQRVVAVDGVTGGRSLVPIVDGLADHGAIGVGTLELRVLPYASVFIGELALGDTPVAAQRLPAGTYEVRFVYPAGELVREVDIVAGATARLKVDVR